MRTLVVVPARDEAARIGACLDALATQEGAGAFGVVLVLDGCTDATGAIAVATAEAAGLPLEIVEGPGRGVGHARRAGLERAAARLRAGAARAPVLASTDADSVVAPGWLARTLAHLDAGAAAVGGRITLDPGEAALLPPAVLDAREREAARRLAAVRRHAPHATHHQFSGASLALTLAAYDAVGGLPAVAALEDEALERALQAAGLPIAYPADVGVTTSARTTGHTPRGLAQVLRTAAWRAGAAAERGPTGAPPPPAAVVVEDGPERARALRDAARARGVVLVLAAGVGAAQAAPLLAALAGDPGLALARAAEPEPDPLAELVARPALNLHAPELAVVTSPLTRTWAIRAERLAELALPEGAALDLAVLVDVWRRHGLGAIAERPLAVPAPAPHPDPSLAAYELLAALAARFPGPPVLSSAFADPDGTRRARLTELAPA